MDSVILREGTGRFQAGSQAPGSGTYMDKIPFPRHKGTQEEGQLWEEGLVGPAEMGRHARTDALHCGAEGWGISGAGATVGGQWLQVVAGGLRRA